MKEIIRRNLAFLLPWSLFVLAGGIVTVFFPKGDIHIYINQFHNNFSNHFFYYSTFIGDGIAVVLIVVTQIGRASCRERV